MEHTSTQRLVVSSTACRRLTAAAPKRPPEGGTTNALPAIRLVALRSASLFVGVLPLVSFQPMLTVTLLLSLFITIALGFYVLVAAPHHPVNRAFTLFNGLMVLWIVKDLAFWGFHEAETNGHWWAASSFIIGLALQYALLIFADVFPENGRVRWQRVGLFALPLLILLPLLFTNLLWDFAGFRAGQFTITLKPAALVFGGYNFFLLLIGFAELARKRHQYRDTLWGQQLGAVMLAKGATSTLTILAVNLLPLLGFYRLLPLSSLFIVVGSLIYAYAISNFKLFSLQTALDQLRLFPLAYKVALAVTLTGLLGFFLCQVPIALWSFGANVEGWKRFLIFSTIAGLVPTLVLILLIVKIISRPLRELTETALVVSRGDYGAETPVNSNDELGVLAASFNAMSRKMAEDIARLKAINQMMVRNEKLATAGALATGVAHEVNNPLAAISSLVQSLLTRAEEEKQRETLRLILSQITRISGVLRDLMDFARPKAPELKPTDLNQVILKSLELARFDKRFKQLTVTTSLAGDLPPLQLDADRMQQVFLNLLLNARDAIDESASAGQISITTSRDNGEVRAEIADNGSGIPAENLERIFDPFFSTKPKGQGTGLGLAVSHSIVTAHGGRISVSSGETGTNFVLEFVARLAAEIETC
jgi:signal transduction histidine kinase